jgi:hypothetical protein
MQGFYFVNSSYGASEQSKSTKLTELKKPDADAILDSNAASCPTGEISAHSGSENPQKGPTQFS